MTSDLDMELIKDRKKGEKNNEIDRNLTDLVSGTHTHTHTQPNDEHRHFCC